MNGCVRRNRVLLAGAFLWALAPSAAFACACGCGVFEVGTSSLFPGGQGGTAFLEYDFLDQTKNWSGSSHAPAADNDDKRIRTNFFVAGAQYMFNGNWGAMVEIPYTDRYFHSADPGNTGIFAHGALGDVRLMGMYTGFSPNMSSGVLFGFKLPTGDSTYAHFDSDVEIGSGSTDALLGVFHRGAFNIEQTYGYFVQAMWQHEIATQHGYIPGSEFNGAAGVSYAGFDGGAVSITPILQMLVSYRGRDGGIGEPDNTGYTRLLISPGIEAGVNAWKVYADVELPLAQHVNGNQLIAPLALKLIVSRNF